MIFVLIITHTHTHTHTHIYIYIAKPSHGRCSRWFFVWRNITKLNLLWLFKLTKKKLFNNNMFSNRSQIFKWDINFETNGIWEDLRAMCFLLSGSSITSRTLMNFTRVQDSVRQSPFTSLRLCRQGQRISEFSIRSLWFRIYNFIPIGASFIQQLSQIYMKKKGSHLIVVFTKYWRWQKCIEWCLVFGLRSQTLE